MQDQRIEKIAAVAVNITKVLVIIFQNKREDNPYFISLCNKFYKPLNLHNFLQLLILVDLDKF